MTDVLNKGFVNLVDHMGSDLSVVNAARISFSKRKDKLDDSDKKLIHYLAKHKHTSPFRHTALQFHIKAPEFVLRQWYKHVVGCEWTSGENRFVDHGWNEISGRYVKYEPEFYVPSSFRPQAQNNKQASEDGDLSDVIVNEDECAHRMPDGKVFNFVSPYKVKTLYEDTLCEIFHAYEDLIKAGVCREQARCLLPVCFYTEVYWTASLQAVVHFCKLRLDEHAQYEIREYAKVVSTLIREKFPISFDALIANTE
jgi:thymidylate synthase (FAD)